MSPPHHTIHVQHMEDSSELAAAKDKARVVSTVVLRLVHGWILKRGNRARGYCASYAYIKLEVATNIGRAIWYGKDWRVHVSPGVCHTTVSELGMDLPVWFA
eukprot:TRINITY_DN2992_c0_g1_i2.p2 TRINITY_DN2992_c0_g1~~TRINITY_DN2992_c0_g1_i2.p2  ORF type:complete len:102 (-),score=10.22 TRINITY_DN2992_c0_g1_i2:567-872(-)